ncbi:MULTISPECIES: carbohydrate ABC transporter substrate-binding protein [Streptomyces]|uniref:Carbohydrate ABC transporter substrate-binding protein n=1 Tax=Streptomyces glycanivorans TaxID=3033808 RepID=A0ABY9J365_9ACTN|nr:MULTISPECIES: carbohydrate ABC transporter substrate-binding protein [unclassified Streptomyces]WSQ75690.1 carbohydrate ABC transporter substrate-binding protein [Streptomyces sp. NBC_01213]TXS06868.1 carbohydrate ABC transporter substrate-binding protein [Streptomyces sp. wa22]WLQ62181.1 carbohydrate ABC transporter substrate-binding protein [Streptomyces sp. Alt3]WSQ82934.1 carbohydrate ABC transporter substrate-binding protein [Streptomyces sp. NBC_01212]WSR04610.1 carbohydrate ABC trans
MRRSFALAGTAVTALALLVGCSSGGDAGSGKTTLKVAALEGGYGRDMYTQVIKAYEASHPDVDVQLQISKSIEDEITPNMKAGKYPDVVVLGQGRKAALTETLVKDKALEDLTPVLGTKVPGEDGTVGDKLTQGVIGNLNTNPYGTDKTYLLPMYYAPTGLFYNQGLFEKNGWKVPSTWDEMFELGDKAKKQGIALFTYPTAGYLDSYFYALLADVGGEQFYNDVMTYKKDVWKTANAKKALDLTTKLLSYASESTVGYANEQDFTKNQQSILDNKALFMPNGTWITGEMADAPRADGFTWGLTTLPAATDGGKRYLTTSVESVWMPSAARNKDAAKDFIAYLYSDEAAEIFAKSNAIQPVEGIANSLTGESAEFYKLYEDSSVSALVGGFASTAPVQGVDIKATLFDTANSIISGDTTESAWQSALNDASEKLRQAGN